MKLNLTVAQVAQITGSEAPTLQDQPITALCSLEDAHEGGLCYLTSLEKAEMLKDLKASALLVPESAKENSPSTELYCTPKTRNGPSSC